MRRQKRKSQTQKGFTLVELLISSAILMIAIVGILVSYLRCLELAEIAKNKTTAMNAVKSRMEQIKNTDFANVMANYNSVTFTTPGLNGMGGSYVTTTIINPDVLEVTISFSLKQTNTHLIGEDTNLNGVVNGGEDKNGNGILDSPVQLVSSIYNV